jgi:hypothetical protein
MTSVSLFAISDPVFLNNWTTTKKALFLFIAFDLPQSYVSCGLQGFVASKMSIKPKKTNLQGF